MSNPRPGAGGVSQPGAEEKAKQEAKETKEEAEKREKEQELNRAAHARLAAHERAEAEKRKQQDIKNQQLQQAPASVSGWRWVAKDHLDTPEEEEARAKVGVLADNYGEVKKLTPGVYEKEIAEDDGKLHKMRMRVNDNGSFSAIPPPTSKKAIERYYREAIKLADEPVTLDWANGQHADKEYIDLFLKICKEENKSGRIGPNALSAFEGGVYWTPGIQTKRKDIHEQLKKVDEHRRAIVEPKLDAHRKDIVFERNTAEMEKNQVALQDAAKQVQSDLGKVVAEPNADKKLAQASKALDTLQASVDKVVGSVAMVSQELAVGVKSEKHLLGYQHQLHSAKDMLAGLGAVAREPVAQRQAELARLKAMKPDDRDDDQKRRLVELEHVEKLDRELTQLKALAAAKPDPRTDADKKRQAFLQDMLDGKEKSAQALVADMRQEFDKEVVKLPDKNKLSPALQAFQDKLVKAEGAIKGALESAQESKDKIIKDVEKVQQEEQAKQQQAGRPAPK